MSARHILAACRCLAAVMLMLSAPFLRAEPLNGSVDLVPGLNLVGIPVDESATPDLATLLTELGDSDTLADIRRFNRDTQLFELCAYDASGGTVGEGCEAPVVPGEGWLVTASVATTIGYDVDLACPIPALAAGLNLAAFPCAEEGLTAQTLTQDLGGDPIVASVQTFDLVSGRWLSTVNTDDQPVGADFPILPGLAYLISLREVPPPTTITLTPSPAAMVTRDTLALTARLDAAAGSGGLVIELTAGNTLVTLPDTVTVPAGQANASFEIASGTETGSVSITATATGLTGDSQTVPVSAREFTLSSPLVGLDRTVTGTLTLVQPAPEGGATFALSVNDTAIATVSPGTLTVPAGSSRANFELTGGLVLGTTELIADGTSDGYTLERLEITVSDRLVNLPPAQEAPVGVTTTLPVTIAPEPAPPGGVEVTLASSESGVVEVLTSTVIIPEGELGTSASIRGVSARSEPANITASSPGLAPDVTEVYVTSALHILETFSNFQADETDDIYVRLQAAGNPFPAPPPAVAITLTAADPACVAVTLPVNIAGGETLTTATLRYGGTAALPCTTTVTAVNTVFGSDVVEVTVGPVPDLGDITIRWADTSNDTRLGSGLQSRYRVDLPTDSHGGISIQLESSDPSLALLAPDATTAGGPVLEVFVRDGQSMATFFIQSLGGMTGPVTITGQNPRLNDDTFDLDVVRGALQILSLDAESTTLSPDDPFNVRTGIPNTAGTVIVSEQEVSASGSLTVTFTSSQAAVGELVTETTSGPSVDIEIPPNESRSATSVETGGVALDPLSVGETTVTATAAGFDPAFAHASKLVSVSEPGIAIDPSVNPNDTRLGSGLQSRYRLTLGGADHGGVTVGIESGDPALALLAPEANTPGASSIDLAFADGETSRFFYIQGVSGATGPVIITATSDPFNDGTFDLEVVRGVFQILSLDDEPTTLSADDPFYVRTGIPNATGSGIVSEQAVSANGPLAVTFTSSDAGVGQLVTEDASGPSVSIDIPPNASRSATSVANGGVAFDPTGGGETIVSTSAIGFDPAFSRASQLVTVSQPGMTIVPIEDLDDTRLGSGLQSRYRLTLGGAAHGGVAVRIQSGDPSVALVAPDATTPGASSVDVVLVDGEANQDFYIQAVRGATGPVTITATSPLFSDGTFNLEVVQGVFQILSLDTEPTTLSTDDPFNVRTGIPSTAGTGVASEQEVSANGPLTVTLTSSNEAVGRLVTTSAGGKSVSIEIPPNASRSATSVAAGGVAFDPTGGGETTVSTAAVGFDPAFLPASTVVTVSQPGMTIQPAQTLQDLRLGSGLQSPYRLTLEGADHGGVIVRIQSSEPALALVAPDATTPGTPFIDVALANGEKTRDFYIQGVSGAMGPVILTGTSPLFNDGTFDFEIVPSAFQILDLATTTTTLSVDDPFAVRTGIPNSIGTAIVSVQEVSANGLLTVTLTSSNSTVGQLVTTDARGPSVSIDIPPNANRSAASVESGGVAFDPIIAGETTVTATAVGFDPSFLRASQVVGVAPSTITLTPDEDPDDTTLGSGLQSRYLLTLGGADHGGVTVRITSGDTATARIAADEVVAGTYFVDVFLSDGVDTRTFYVQGVTGAAGDVEITASNELFADGTLALAVVAPVLDILGLNLSTTVAANDDAFYVRAGIADSTGTSFVSEQEVSAASSEPLTVTFTSSDPGVGEVVTTTSGGALVTAVIAPAASRSPTTVATGGVAFDAIAVGDTTVGATASNFDNTFPLADETVSVGP